MSTPTGEITKIQLKTKVTSDSDKPLSEVPLDKGEPLFNTNDNTLTIGTTENGNASQGVTFGAGKLVVNSSSESVDDTASVLTNGNVHINHVENNKALSSHKVVGARSVKVTADANADITVSADFELSTTKNSTNTTGVDVILKDIEANILDSEAGIDKFNIKGSGATEVTSDGNGNIDINTEYTLTATQQEGENTNASDIKLSGDTTDDIVTIKGGDSTEITTNDNVITISDTAAHAHSETNTDASPTNLEYITEVTQSKGQISAKKKTLSGTANNISVTTAANGTTTIKDIANYEHSSTKVDATANNLEYLVEVTQTDGTIAAKKKTLQGTKDNISVTVGTDGKAVIKDIAEVKDDSYKNTDSQYVAKVTQTDGKIAYTKHTIEGTDNISVSTSSGKTTIKNTAALTDTAVDNKYVSEVDQDKGQITVSRRTILEDTDEETANNASTSTSNGNVEVITSFVKPATSGATNTGIIPKKRKIKGAKDIEVVVGQSTSDITVQHSNTVKDSQGNDDNNGKSSTTQTANGTKITNGGTFTISDVNYNAQGHVTSENTATLTLPQYKSGTGINVEADTATTDVSNDYKVNLQTATTSTIGGVKIHKDTTGYAVTAKTSGALSADVSNNDHYRAVEIDKNDKAFVYINLADTATNGIAKLHPSDKCTTYTSDDGGATPGAVKKAADHDTKLFVGNATTASNTEDSNPYIKIVENKYDFTAQEKKSSITNKIQVKGGTGVTVSSSTAGDITITNAASVGDTTNNTTDSKDYIVSVSGSNGSITPTKKVLTAGTGITITTGTGETDGDKAKLTIGHSNSVTAKSSYSDIYTDNNAQVNIVTPTYDAQGHVTGTADQKLTVGAASTAKLGTVRAGYTDSGANIKLNVESDGDAYVTLTETAIAYAGGITSVSGGGVVSVSQENDGEVTVSDTLPDSIRNKYTGKTVGGVDANTQITDTSVENLLKRILGIKEGVAPSGFNVTLKTRSVSLDLGTTEYTVDADWSVNGGTYTGKYTPIIGYITGPATSSTSGTITDITIGGITDGSTSKSVSGSLSHDAGTGFEANTLSDSDTLTINRYCYVGGSPTELEQSECSSKKSLSYAGYGWGCPTFQYPRIWGTCTIYDGNGYDVTRLFVLSEPSLHGGTYYQYTLKEPVQSSVKYTIQ